LADGRERGKVEIFIQYQNLCQMTFSKLRLRLSEQCCKKAIVQRKNSQRQCWKWFI